MVVAMMSVLVVILIIRATRRVVIWISAFMMIQIMGMKARGGHVLLQVPMQPGRRRPGELERDDEHDDQGNEATHGVHSTEITLSTKGSFVSWLLMALVTQGALNHDPQHTGPELFSNYAPKPP